MSRNNGYLLFFLLYVSSNSANGPITSNPTIESDNTRIVGGEAAQDRADFPYQVSLRLASKHRCGASIINEQHILTSALCVIDEEGRQLPPWALTAVVGDLYLDFNSSTTVFKEIESIIIHEEFNLITFANCIAILKIKGTFEFTEFINRIKRASTTPAVDTRCRISGWGTLHEASSVPSPLLQFVDLSISPYGNCNATYSAALPIGTLCASYGNGGKGPCHGDIGSPLVCNDRQAGIFGGYGEGCGHSFPSLYLDVAYYSDWIHTKASSNAAFLNLYLLVACIFTYLHF
ncbi:hypothetical protein Trydic_g21530 [Trypoxylus dichotomus]